MLFSQEFKVYLLYMDLYKQTWDIIMKKEFKYVVRYDFK